MASYTDPVEKQWVMGDYEAFKEGTIDGVELNNPNFADKIVTECHLGENLLGASEKDWNPSFEVENLLEPWRPNHWRFEANPAGSYYQKDDPEGAYDGADYVVIRDESNEPDERGSLRLWPEGSANPNNLNVDVDPQKTYTVRYHGKYIKQGPGEDRGPVGRVGVKDDTAETEVLEFEPFVATEGAADVWQEEDYRITPSEAQERKVMLLKLFFGGTAVRKSFPELSWAIDQVELAETCQLLAAVPTYGVRTPDALHVDLNPE